MRVDQARHDPLSAGVQHFDLAAVLQPDVRGQRADAARLTALAESQKTIVPTRGQQAEADRLAGLAEYYEQHRGAGSS